MGPDYPLGHHSSHHLSTMSQPIDIYECPARDEYGHLPVAYMTAVMSVGLPHNTQFRLRGWAGWGSYAQENDDGADWNWASYDYRIDPASRPVGGDSVRAFKVGDWVVCLGPNHKMHSGNQRLFTTGALYRVYGDPNNHPSLRPDDESYGGFGLFDWRLASQTEIAAHLSSQVAIGHNPHGLTVSQVGAGYRLLTHGEIRHRPSAVSHLGHIEAWYGVWNRGDNVDGWCGSDAANTYRTKLSAAELAALIAPRPKVKVPLTSADYPPVFWVRNAKDNARWAAFLVTAIQVNGGFYLTNAGGQSTFWAPNQIMETLEYSTDRITWLPCHKLVES